MGLRFIADAEQRIKQQKQMIAQLRRKGQSTAQAEALLLAYERSLLMGMTMPFAIGFRRR
jgi:hypothetical protein